MMVKAVALVVSLSAIGAGGFTTEKDPVFMQLGEKMNVFSDAKLTKPAGSLEAGTIVERISRSGDAIGVRLNAKKSFFLRESSKLRLFKVHPTGGGSSGIRPFVKPKGVKSPSLTPPKPRPGNPTIVPAHDLDLPFAALKHLPLVLKDGKVFVYQKDVESLMKEQPGLLIKRGDGRFRGFKSKLTPDRFEIPKDLDGPRGGLGDGGFGGPGGGAR